MNQKYLRPIPEFHFALRFLATSAFSLALAGLGSCNDRVSPHQENDIISPNGVISPEPGTRYMVFPPSPNTVRLYLIDTGISHQTEWFSRKRNLKFEEGYYPISSTSTLHGTRMLDIIAGPESGALSGTPLHVVSMNVYGSDHGSTTSGLLADAIFEAIDREQDAIDPQIPALICMASGSVDQASSAILENAIDQAVAAGIPVIVSAGNGGAEAAKFVPSGYGVKDGVICVGAYGKDLHPLAMSNWGAAVDLQAPGEGVRTLSLPQPSPGLHHGMTGTSPAAALATAAALHRLSMNPELSPAQLEAALGESVTAPAPAGLERGVTAAGGEKFFDVSFVSCQLLSPEANGGLIRHGGCSFDLEWSQDLKTWETGRFTPLGQPVEVAGGWRYTFRSKTPVLSRVRLADLTVKEAVPRLITSITVNDALLVLPRAPYQLPEQAAALQQDLLAAGFEGASVGPEGGKGYRIHVPAVVYSTPHPGSWVTWPPYVAGIDPLSGQPMISAGVSFKALYSLPDGTPVDPPVQMARLKVLQP
jgi:hypothetical protein